MSVYFVVVVYIALKGAKICDSGWHEDYLSRRQTRRVEAVFVMLIFLSHLVQYTNPGGVWDDAYLAVRSHLGQMVVVPFLFYSGYGTMQGLGRDLKGYHYKLISKRFPRILLQFDLAVLLYLMVQWVLGVRPGPKQIVLSLIGWKSLGNSNWYMFAMFCIYLLTFVAFFPFVNGKGRWGLYAGCYVFTILTVIFVIIQIKMARPDLNPKKVTLFFH